MQQIKINSQVIATHSAVAMYLHNVTQPHEKKTLGSMVLEMIREGERLSRKSLCSRLLIRLEQASDSQESQLYQNLLNQLFD